MNRVSEAETGNSLRAAIIGMGGFANHHVAQLLEGEAAQRLDFVAAIDPDPSRCEHLAAIEEHKIPVYASIDDFASTGAADLMIVSTPIHLHCAHTLAALDLGCDVYCEKPVAATIQDARAMLQARDAAGRRVAVGYQWSYSDAIRELKADILAGDFGRPRRFRTVVCGPRGPTYYGRNNWAGRLQTDAGEWILDSPVSNAMSHYLHNCFYVLGDAPHTSAMPADVQAELYRAKNISNFDTAALRVHTDDGVEILYYASHAVASGIGPVMTYEFENATVTFDRDADPRFIARFHDGTLREYGSPDGGSLTSLSKTADAIRNNRPFGCELEAAIPLTLTANLAQESAGEIVDFPRDIVNDDTLVAVRDLESIFTDCCARGCLPSEDPDLDWAVAGAVVRAAGYDSFPGPSRAATT